MQKNFINEIHQKVMHMPQVNQEQYFLIGGDFNCVLNARVDWLIEKGENAKKPDIGMSEIKMYGEEEITW